MMVPRSESALYELAGDFAAAEQIRSGVARAEVAAAANPRNLYLLSITSWYMHGARPVRAMLCGPEG